MEDRNRNFRSYYYEKVGFRVVEEKKSLEILFKENPIDKKKLTHFTLRFTVPNTYRNALYCVLLDVLPTCSHQHVWTFVKKQRKEQFEDLQHSLRLLQVNNQHITKPQLYALMKALENGNLKLNYQHQLGSHDNLVFMNICEALVRIAESESDLYWISKGFYKLFLSFRPYLRTLAAYTHKIFLKEDQKLYHYLVDHDIWKNLPLESWYENALLALLPSIALQKVWDKLLGGSSIYMVFVILCLLLKIRNSIFQVKTVQKLIDCTKQLTESCFEMIVTEAIALWQNYGCPLHPGSNTDCFKDHSKFGSKSSITTNNNA